MSEAFVVKDMALTQAEFFRHLPLALRGWRQEADSTGRVAAVCGERRVWITAEPLPPRRIGPTLTLPRCAVTLRFEGFDQPTRQAFLTAFDRAFQRSGG